MGGPRSSRGQVLVIFAGGLIVVLAIAALVIDLGFAFMIRRQAQNAADPGAIAAARYIRSGGSPDTAGMRRAACFYARINGFFPSATTDDGCNPANDPHGTTLTVNYPPSPAAGTYSGRTGFVEVTLNRQHQTFLARVIGLATIPVSSSAVGAFSDGDSNTSSLIALDPSSNCSAARTHGTGDINIFPLVPGTIGGYVHVNSTCGSATKDTACLNDSSGALTIGGTSTLTAPHTYVAGTCKSNGSGLYGTLSEGAVQIGDPLLELPPPNPADYPAGKCSPTDPPLTPTSTGCVFKDAEVFNLEPGVYYGGWNVQKNGATLELAPGVYILAGGGIKLTSGGSITSVQGGTGDPAPVLIYNTDNPATGTGQDNIDFNASATLKLRAIETGPYRGIVVWNDGKGSNPGAIIDLKGQSSLDISGTIYSPKGFVNLEGGGSGTSTAAVQIISWTWDVGGNADLNMPYDPSKLYRFSQKGLVR
jgi:Flp pilus assembly protein TadG